MRGRIVVAIVVVAAMAGLGGCRVARAGTRCNTTDWGRDSTHALQCRNGRWVRVMTLAQAAHAIAEVNAARAAAATTTTVPFVAEPALRLKPGAAFEAVYALTSDQTDDPTMVPAIQHELSQVSDWFAGQTGGRRPRFVTSGAAVLVRTVHLALTAAQVAASTNATHLVEGALAAQGVPAANHRTVVYLDTQGDACGATAPAGTVSVIFMAECDIYPDVTSTWHYGATYVVAHEMTHAFGAVDDCAPHATGDGHTGDDPRDVLYSGSAERDWDHITLDPGHDDYYRTGRTDCYDIANSPLWAS
jgi:hypothetical protein